MSSVTGSPTADKDKNENEDGLKQIELEIDTLDAFDYENVENAKFTVKQLKQILVNEIKLYNYCNDDRERSMLMNQELPSKMIVRTKISQE